MKYLISSLGFWSKNVTSILNKNILLLKKKKRYETEFWLFVVFSMSSWCNLSIINANTKTADYTMDTDTVEKHDHKHEIHCP